MSARYILRYWRHWTTWLPPYAHMSVRGYRLQAVHGHRQGFPYIALHYVRAGTRRDVVWKLIPTAHGLALWHRPNPDVPAHRHGTLAWQHQPGLTWARRLQQGCPCPAPAVSAATPSRSG